MKREVFLAIGIALFVICIVVLILLFLKKEVPIGKITSFDYHTRKGMAIYDRVSYKMDCTKDICNATILFQEVADEDAIFVRVTDEENQELQEILKKYHIGKWDGFKKHNKHVLDGSSFSLTVHMETGDIDAYGYMKYPSNYKKAMEEIHSFFHKLAEKKD